MPAQVVGTLPSLVRCQRDDEDVLRYQARSLQQNAAILLVCKSPPSATDWPENTFKEETALCYSANSSSIQTMEEKREIYNHGLFFLFLQPLGYYYGKLPPTGCHHTQVLTSHRYMICWRRDIGWNNLRDVLQRFMN